jgi:hypothetical protein
VQLRVELRGQGQPVFELQLPSRLHDLVRIPLAMPQLAADADP